MFRGKKNTLSSVKSFRLSHKEDSLKMNWHLETFNYNRLKSMMIKSNKIQKQKQTLIIRTVIPKMIRIRRKINKNKKERKINALK